VPAAADHLLRITGGRELAGSICVSGSKNAALPEMAAAILTRDQVRLKNVPRVTDTRVMGDIIRALGGSAEGEGDVVLDATNATSADVPPELGRRMRATILMLGALVGRFRKARVPRPGGDDIGARRVEQHLRGLRQMGARIEDRPDELFAEADELHGARIVFDLPTVTGTENILLAAVLADGRTEIFNAAREPHVQDLCWLLGKMGARIEGIGSEHLVIDGVKELHGADHTVIPDYLEAGTYALAAAAAGGDVRLGCSSPQDLNIVLLKLEQAGIDTEVGKGWFRVARKRSNPIKPTDMSTWPYPGFPTDLQAQYMAFMTQADGETVISEYVHENSFQHVTQLARMGADIAVEGRLHAFVHGPCTLKGTELAVPDIRSGAALIIAGLVAQGHTIIEGKEHIERGYADLVAKLSQLGATISDQ